MWISKKDEGAPIEVVPEGFEATRAKFQRRLKLSQQSAEVDFPLVLAAASTSAESFISSASSLGAGLRGLLDRHGGAVHLTRTPLRTASDMSAFLFVLLGGEYTPHVDKGLMVIRRTLAPNVATANEGPATLRIGSHNEYGLSTHFPDIIAFFCVSPPETGGETPIANSIELLDRLKREVPEYTDRVKRDGIEFVIHHPESRRAGSVQGNGVYEANAFGDGTGKGDREVVERQVKALASEGGWQDGLKPGQAPAWKRLGFSCDWVEGGVNVTQRVPGIRTHPTLGLPSYFNNVGNRYGYTKENGCLDPPHRAEDGSFYPPPAYAGGDPIPHAHMETAEKVTNDIAAKIAWQTGDLLILDNLAVQHAREPWTGDRRLLASLWDNRARPAAA